MKHSPLLVLVKDECMVDEVFPNRQLIHHFQVLGHHLASDVSTPATSPE